MVHQEGTTGHRERNDIVTYENGIEVARELAHQTIMVESTPAIIEQEQSRRQRISNHWQVGISHQDSDAAGEECTRALTGDARSEQPFMHPVQELLSVPVTAKDMAIMLSSAIRMAE